MKNDNLTMNYPDPRVGVSCGKSEDIVKQRQLLPIDFFILFPLLLDILLDHFFRAVRSYCICIISTCPKVTAPQEFFHFWVLFEYHSCCYTFYCCDNFLYCYCRYTLDKKMNMINIASYFKKSYFITLADSQTHLFQCVFYLSGKYLSSVFRWKHYMV